MPVKQVVSSGDVLHDFGLWTSGHGYRRIIKAESNPAKIIWALITIVCTILFLVNFINVLQTYLEYPSRVTTHRSTEGSIFPAITICNINPLRRSQSSASLAEFTSNAYNVYPITDWQTLYDSTATSAPDPTTTTTTPATTNTPVATTAVDSAATTTTASNDTTVAPGRRKKRSAEALRNDMVKYLAIVAQIPQSERIAAEHQKQDMILSCNFAGSYCNRDKDFEYFYHARYGACYTFNLGQNVTEQLEQPGTGPITGFQAILNAELDDYLDDIPVGEGMRIVIHSPRTRPPIEEHGFNISPGTSTSINLRLTFIERLGAPYQECKDPDAPKKKTRFTAEQNNDPYSYSVSECMTHCTQEQILIACNCVTDPVVAVGQTICDSDKSTCVEDTISGSTADCSNECPAPCHDSVFGYTVSQSIWPTQLYWDSVIEQVRGLSVNVDEDIRSGVITRNLQLLKVYYSDSGYDEHEQVPAYTVYNVMADIGGISALFIGWSVLTLVEFFELLILLCSFRCCGYETKNGAPSKTHEVYPDGAQTPVQRVNIPTPSHPAQPLQAVPELSLADRMKMNRDY